MLRNNWNFKFVFLRVYHSGRRTECFFQFFQYKKLARAFVHFRDAFLQKSIQLENLQRELAAIKGDTLKFASRRNNYQLSHCAPFPRRSFNQAPQTMQHKARSSGESLKFCFLKKEKGSYKNDGKFEIV